MATAIVLIPGLMNDGRVWPDRIGRLSRIARVRVIVRPAGHMLWTDGRGGDRDPGGVDRMRAHRGLIRRHRWAAPNE